MLKALLGTLVRPCLKMRSSGMSGDVAQWKVLAKCVRRLVQSPVPAEEERRDSGFAFLASHSCVSAVLRAVDVHLCAHSGSCVSPADCSTFRVDTAVIKQRVPILLKYLDSDTEKELQALYALQASIVKLDQPASKCPAWCREPSSSGDLWALKLGFGHGQ